jgi:hypothetical protein
VAVGVFFSSGPAKATAAMAASISNPRNRFI